MGVVYRYDPTCGNYCNGPRMECFKDGDWIVFDDYVIVEKQRDATIKEVERLREVVRKVHKLVESAEHDYRALIPILDKLREIRKLTKEEP